MCENIKIIKLNTSSYFSNTYKSFTKKIFLVKLVKLNIITNRKKEMFLFTLFTIIISLVNAKNCPAPPVQQNFNIPKVKIL
jgi:hypothetical protein